MTKRSFQQYINDLITERLKSALTKESATQKVDATPDPDPVDDDDKIVTTEEELEGFMIVKTILRQAIPVSRIVYRDAQSYFAILLDDNNRKTICRLYFNSARKYIGLFDENKKETKVELLSLDDIFLHAAALLKCVTAYDNKKAGLVEPEGLN